MSNNCPVSDLKNNSDVLLNVAAVQPDFLTENDYDCNAAMDSKEDRDCEKTKAVGRLLSELDKGRISGEQNGWLSANEVFNDIEARCYS